jgi:hypothetical protein
MQDLIWQPQQIETLWRQLYWPLTPKLTLAIGQKNGVYCCQRCIVIDLEKQIHTYLSIIFYSSHTR